VAVPREELYAFCERYSPSSVDSVRFALASLGRTVYSQMVESRGIRIIAEVDYCDPGLARTGARWFHVSRRLREWWNGLYSARDEWLCVTVRRDAQERGIELLTKNLSPTQRAQYDSYGYFEVMGGDTGKRYRITEAYQMNVLEIGQNGKRTRSLCFVPRGGLVLGDVMLAQKLALELFESQALEVANTSNRSRVPPIALLP
jgi:hypothetical protein